MGPVLCLISAACFGAMAIFAKLAYAAGITPGTLLLLRFTLAASLLGALLVLRPGLRTHRSPLSASAGPKRRTGRLVLTALCLGAAGYATQAALYYAALTRIDASMVALVLYTYPALVTLVAALLGRERLTPARAAAVLVASAGTLLVLLGAGGVRFDGVGVELAFGSAVVYTVYILVSDTVVHHLPPVVLSVFVMTGAAVALVGRAVVWGGVDLAFRPAGWLWVGCIAVVSTVAAMLAFFGGMRRTGPSTAAILSTLEPVVTTALAAGTLGEFLTPVQLVGGLLVLCSAGVVQIRPRRRSARPASAAEFPPVPATAQAATVPVG